MQNAASSEKQIPLRWFNRLQCRKAFLKTTVISNSDPCALLSAPTEACLILNFLNEQTCKGSPAMLCICIPHCTEILCSVQPNLVTQHSDTFHTLIPLHHRSENCAAWFDYTWLNLCWTQVFWLKLCQLQNAIRSDYIFSSNEGRVRTALLHTPVTWLSRKMRSYHTTLKHCCLMSFTLYKTLFYLYFGFDTWL
jgi:hypothetical protein